MKRVWFTILVCFISGLNVYATNETLIKIYMSDGCDVEVINIDDIDKMSIKKISNNFTMKVYFKNDSSLSYQTIALDSLKFTTGNDIKYFDVYYSAVTKSYLVSEIDSIIFQEITDDTETVTIGTQVWMKKNLDVTHYRNGDPIPQVTDPTEWLNLTTGAWCYCNNDAANGEIYGKLYNWYAVNDSRGLAPDGWHVASDAEWKTLEKYLGMTQAQADNWGFRGTTQGSKLAGGYDLWYSGNLRSNSDFNSSGFSGLPGGYRSSYGYFYFKGYFAVWWSATEYSSTYAVSRYLDYDSTYVYRDYYNKSYGFSVRCLRD